MIYDGENMFFYKKGLSASEITSDVIYVGEGEAGDPLFLTLSVDKAAGDGTITTVLETSKTEDFAEPVVLGTFTQCPLSVKLPRGNLGYLRIKATSTHSTGTITAGLVVDDNISW